MMKRARPGLRSRLRVALSAWLAGVLLCISGLAFADTWTYTDGSFQFADNSGNCFSTEVLYQQSVLANFPPAFGWKGAPGFLPAGCTYNSAGVITGLTFELFDTKSGTRFGRQTYGVTLISEAPDQLGTLFSVTDFGFVFATVFVSSLSLYFVAYGIGLVLAALKS
jgi:hypothetical protein